MTAMTRRKCNCCRKVVVTSHWGRDFLCGKCRPTPAVIYVVDRIAGRISHASALVINLPA